jgi:DNA-binding Lrp family transcriptional regulator
MSDFDLTELDTRVLAELTKAFPVSESPYCDLAAVLGATEIDVVNSAEKLREIGAITRVTAIFPDSAGVIGEGSQTDADIAEIVSSDLPYGEHPFAEVAAQLELRGTQVEGAEVIARIREWLADGTVSAVLALTD